MTDSIEALLSAYERGACSRRRFIAAISSLVSVPTIAAARPQPVWEEANDRGLVIRENVNGRCVVALSLRSAKGDILNTESPDI
jgi:hypothetical protein